MGTGTRKPDPLSYLRRLCLRGVGLRYVSGTSQALTSKPWSVARGGQAWAFATDGVVLAAIRITDASYLKGAPDRLDGLDHVLANHVADMIVDRPVAALSVGSCPKAAIYRLVGRPSWALKRRRSGPHKERVIRIGVSNYSCVLIANTMQLFRTQNVVVYVSDEPEKPVVFESTDRKRVALVMATRYKGAAEVDGSAILVDARAA